MYHSNIMYVSGLEIDNIMRHILTFQIKMSPVPCHNSDTPYTFLFMFCDIWGRMLCTRSKVKKETYESTIHGELPETFNTNTYVLLMYNLLSLHSTMRGHGYSVLQFTLPHLFTLGMLHSGQFI